MPPPSRKEQENLLESALYEVGEFIVHFFNREQIEHLAKGFTIIAVDELEEGTLPRKL